MIEMQDDATAHWMQIWAVNSEMNTSYVTNYVLRCCSGCSSAISAIADWYYHVFVTFIKILLLLLYILTDRWITDHYREF